MDMVTSLRHTILGLALCVAPLAVLVGALLAPARVPTALQALTQLAPHSPVYTPAQLHAVLGEGQGPWEGRTVLVLAVVVGGYRFSDSWDGILFVGPPLIADPGPQAGPPLTLQWGAPDPVLARLRMLPLVGGLVPRPQELDLGQPAVYRIQVQAQPCPTWRGGVCDVGVLLDAAPWRCRRLCR
jgi:hypothetical protein